MFNTTVRKLRKLFTSARTSRSTAARRTPLVLEALERRDLLAGLTYVWTGADNKTSPNWSDRVNWLVGGAVPPVGNTGPGPDDSVRFDGTGAGGNLFDSVDDIGQVTSLTITPAYTMKITLNQDLKIGGRGGTIGTADIEGGTITGAHDLLVSDNVGPPAYVATLKWTGGTINLGAGNQLLLGFSGSGTISGAAGVILDSCNFHNFSSNLTWDGRGSITLKNKAQFIAADGATANFTVQDTQNPAKIGAGIFGTAAEQVYVLNGGTLDLRTNGGGLETFAQLNNFGNINVRDGGLLTDNVVNAGTITVFNGQSLFLGLHNSGIRLDSSDPRASGSTITGTGTTQFATGSGVFVYGTANVGTTVEDDSSKIDGDGTLQINGTYTLVNPVMQNTLGAQTGKIQVGSLTNTAASLIFDKATAAYTLARPIINFGTIQWKAAQDITVSNGGRIDNQAGALFDIQVNQTMAKGAGAGAFTNNGTLIKSAGNGLATIQLNVTTSGTTDAKKGKLLIVPWLVQAAGQLIVEAGATLNLGGGFEQDGGTVSVTSATMNVTGNYNELGGSSAFADSTLTAALYTIAPGAGLATSGISTLATPVLNYGNVSVADTLTVAGDYAQLAGLTSSTSANITLSGNFTQTGGQTWIVYGNVAVSGNFTQAGGSSEFDYGSLSAGGFLDVQAGVMLLQGQAFAVLQPSEVGDGLGGGALALLGANLSAPLLRIEQSGSVAATGSTSALAGGVINNGALAVFAGAELDAGGITQAGGGTSIAAGATLAVSGPFDEQGGSIALAGGTLSTATGLTIEYLASLSGYGTLGGTVSNAGEIDDSPTPYNQLTVTGDYSQGSTGLLVITVPQDAFVVNGLASLGGTLSINYNDGYYPNPSGDMWVLVKYGRRSGTFANIPDQPPASGTMTFHYDDGFGALELVVTA